MAEEKKTTEVKTTPKKDKPKKAKKMRTYQQRQDRTGYMFMAPCRFCIIYIVPICIYYLFKFYKCKENNQRIRN